MGGGRYHGVAPGAGGAPRLGAQDAIRQDLCPQASAAVQRLLRARRESLILPSARRAFRHAEEAHALDLKLQPDERIQIDAARDHIPPEGGRRAIPQAEARAEFVVDFLREKGDLPPVVRLEVEEAIALDAATREAADLAPFLRRMLSSRLAVMAKEIVSGREIEVSDVNGRHDDCSPSANDCRRRGQTAMRRRAVPSATRNPFTAVLLAGGRSTRMGCDKAGLLIDGVPLWQRQLATLQALAPDELLISGRLDGPFAGAGIPIIVDDVPGLGPLGGLATILRQMKYERLLLLAIDLPAMTSAFLESLLPVNGVVPFLEGHFEPLAAVYPRRVLPIAERCLAESDHSMQHFIRQGVAESLLAPKPLSAAERAFFRNANSPSDLR